VAFWFNVDVPRHCRAGDVGRSVVVVEGIDCTVDKRGKALVATALVPSVVEAGDVAMEILVAEMIAIDAVDVERVADVVVMIDFVVAGLVVVLLTDVVLLAIVAVAGVDLAVLVVVASVVLVFAGVLEILAVVAIARDRVVVMIGAMVVVVGCGCVTNVVVCSAR